MVQWVTYSLYKHDDNFQQPPRPGTIYYPSAGSARQEVLLDLLAIWWVPAPVRDPATESKTGSDRERHCRLNSSLHLHTHVLVYVNIQTHMHTCTHTQSMPLLRQWATESLSIMKFQRIKYYENNLSLFYIVHIRVLLNILADETPVFMKKYFPTFQELCLGRCEKTPNRTR